MTVLAEMDFKSLEAGMKFEHPEHGEQIILDLSRGQFGPIIQFHNCSFYNGELPQYGEVEDEVNIFEALAARLYPSGAENWEYLGMASPDEITSHGWVWQQVDCPHCGFEHMLLSPAMREHSRNCRSCGMAFSRPSEAWKSEF